MARRGGATAAAAGSLLRAEDWIIFTISIFGAGMALRAAAEDGSDLGIGVSIWEGLNLKKSWECIRHPIRCGVDTAQRLKVRGFFTLGLLAVGLSVALRRFYPRFAGLPYGAWLVLLGFLLFTGGLDELLKTLDPSKLFTSGSKPEPAAPPPTTTTPASPTYPQVPAYQQRQCYMPADVCSGRGGVSVQRQSNGAAGCRFDACTCRDGSSWGLIVPFGQAPVPLSGPAPRCLDPRALTANTGGVAELYRDTRGGCGVVKDKRGNIWDLSNGARLAQADLATRVRTGLLEWVTAGVY